MQTLISPALISHSKPPSCGPVHSARQPARLRFHRLPRAMYPAQQPKAAMSLDKSHPHRAGRYTYPLEENQRANRIDRPQHQIAVYTSYEQSTEEADSYHWLDKNPHPHTHQSLLICIWRGSRRASQQNSDGDAQLGNVDISLTHNSPPNSP